MISAPSNNSKFTVTFQGSASTNPGKWRGYTLSKSMLRIKREDTQQMSVVIMGYAYYTDPKGVLEIPLQSIINDNADSSPYYLYIRMKETDGTFVDDFDMYIDIVPGIDYVNVFAPHNKDAAQLSAAYGLDVVMPPNVIVNPTNSIHPIGTRVESNLHVKNNAVVWKKSVAGVLSSITPTGVRSNRIDISHDADALVCTDNVKTKEWSLEKPDSCTNLIVCRWTSRTGCVRQHWFPVAAFINGADKSVSVVSPGNGYDVRKGTFDAVRCRLTGLTAYGYWYYMDILRASDLHAVYMPTLNVFETEISSMETAAYCDAQDMETPQGNGFYNFEFVLKLRHYDTH